MGRRHRKNPRPESPQREQVNEVTPDEVVTDLKGRPLRIRIIGSVFVADGWGGERAEVPLAAMSRVITYDVERINPKGPNPRWSGILLLNEQEQVILRVTGHWRPSEVFTLFFSHGFYRVTTWMGPENSELRKVRQVNRRKRRAPQWRKLRMRSRWLLLWRVIVALGGFIVLLTLIGVLTSWLGENVGTALGFILGLLLWSMVGIGVPRWIRRFHARHRGYLQESLDDRAAGNASISPNQQP